MWVIGRRASERSVRRLPRSEANGLQKPEIVRQSPFADRMRWYTEVVTNLDRALRESLFYGGFRGFEMKEEGIPLSPPLRPKSPFCSVLPEVGCSAAHILAHTSDHTGSAFLVTPFIRQPCVACETR
jgi:hypothetical protein